ncbi:hypothetical protein BDR03DRAFT_1007140 [Suillus americanus]|nr:hypothetical protein BDR03DRAFT_1007140 [Suillus americanus]
MPIEGFAVPISQLTHTTTDLTAVSSHTRYQLRAQLLQELSVPNVIELKFSPRGTYLSTWARERPVKLEDGVQHKNLRIFSASTSEELISFTQKLQENWPSVHHV